MIQSVKGKVSRSAKNSAHGSLFCIVHFFYTVLVLIRYQATDSSIRWIALLGFAILCDNVAAMCEGDNPRGERKALQRRFPLSP